MMQQAIVTIVVALAAGWIGRRIFRWARGRFCAKSGNGSGCGHGCNCGRN